MQTQLSGVATRANAWPRALLLAALLSACGNNTGAALATQRADIYTIVNLAPVSPLDHQQINTKGKAAFTLLPLAP